MMRVALGLAVGAALAAGCSSGKQGDTASNGSGTSTATNGGSSAGPLTAGSVSTLAGLGGQPGAFADGPGEGDGGARFNRPQAVAIDSQGNFFVADTINNCIRKVDPSGNTTTIASTQGSVLGPSGVAVDSAGDLIVAGGRDFHIWKFPPDGELQLLAGGSNSAYINGVGGQLGAARFQAPTAVALDTQGNVYVADWDYIRKIDTQFNVTTVAGVEGTSGQGLIDGSGGEGGTAQFFLPHGLAVDAAGNIFVADTANNAIRKIDPNGTVTTVAGKGPNQDGFVNGQGGPTGAATFSRPTGVVVDQYGNLYVTDSGNNVIRHIDPKGMVTTWAGTGTSSYGDANAPLQASFANPYGLVLRPGEGLAIADQLNNCIRLIGP